MKESEGLLVQVKSFLRTLGDVVVAMKFTSFAIYNEILDMPPASISADSSATFSEDHALDIQTLYSQFQLEYNRKFNLINDITNNNEESIAKCLGNVSEFRWLNETAVTTALKEWTDEYHFKSFLDIERLQSYMVTNDIVA